MVETQDYFAGKGKLFDQAAPFDKFTAKNLEENFEQSLREAQKQLQNLRETAKTDFESICEGLESCTDSVGQVAGVISTLFSAHRSDEIEQLYMSISPKLAALSSAIWLDEKIFLKVQRIFETRHQLGLTPEQIKLVDEQYKTFRRNGALLNSEQKDQLKKIDEALAQTSPRFAKNVLEETNSVTFPVHTVDELNGLPEQFIQESKEFALAKGSSAPFLLHMQGPMVQAVLGFCTNRGLREKMWKAYNSRGMRGANSNYPVIADILRLRHERAVLLGFRNHAEYVLENRMAETPQKAEALLTKLLQAARPKAELDFTEIRKLAKEDGIELEPWDFSFYSEILKTKKYQLNETELRKFFPVNQVLQGLFLHAKKLFQLEFIERKDLPTYHPDGQVFEVRKSSGYVGLLYLDLFPRESKQGGAWANPFRDAGLWHGNVCAPHVMITCNFSKPVQGKPALLSLNEVTTLFHEFGHASHALLSKCRYRSLAGTNVLWDFVELPSQIMENWCYEPETLQFLSKHIETGEPLSKAWIESIRKVQNFQSGWATLRQLRFGVMDLQLHQKAPSEIGDLKEFEQKASAPYSLFPNRDDVAVLPAFAHIFAGGYSAGYYSYKWAEVLEADAFSLFQKNGVYDRATAERFEEIILSRGGSVHPHELFVEFRGRAPDAESLLRKADLL